MHGPYYCLTQRFVARRRLFDSAFCSCVTSCKRLRLAATRAPTLDLELALCEPAWHIQVVRRRDKPGAPAGAVKKIVDSIGQCSFPQIKDRNRVRLVKKVNRSASCLE
jgi:hypothetical protein